MHYDRGYFDDETCTLEPVDDICEAALAHTRKDKAHAAYQRGDLFEKRNTLMQAWAKYCEPPSRGALPVAT